jgi:hypothetical protein
MSISLDYSVPGAIPNYKALQSTVADWLDRDDLGAKIPTFITLAEAMFNRELRSKEMEKTVTGAVSSEDAELPTDYLAMRAIYEEGSPDRPLKGTSPTSERLVSDGTPGQPQWYALVSGGIRLIPPPASTILLTMDYFGRIPSLSSSQPSNWLLDKHPDAYLYGALYMAEAHLDNATRAAQWKSLVDEVLAKLNRSSRNDRYGAGPLVPNGVTQVRGAAC